MRVVGESETFGNVALLCKSGKKITREMYIDTWISQTTRRKTWGSMGARTDNRSPLADGTIGIPRQLDPHLQRRVMKLAVMVAAEATT